MNDFIVGSPFNGFPFILEKNRVNPYSYHSCVLSLSEAMRFYWLSNISGLELSINIEISPIDESPISISYNFSDFERDFMALGQDLPLEPSKRLTCTSDDFMYRFCTNDDNPVSFYISPPIYLNDEQYEVFFHGSFSFSYEDIDFLVLLGIDYTQNDYIVMHHFSLSIYDQQIPCVLIQTSGRIYGEYMEMSASATISSEWLS